jgi:hypothetical protein
LDRKGQIYFSHLAARVFGARRLAVLEFDPSSHTLKFTAVKTVPEGMVQDDLFRLTWGNGQKNGCGVAMKSLLGYIGFRLNGSPQELDITAMDSGQHSICVVLPPRQMPEDDSPGD